MFKEIVQIIPQLSQSALNTMDRALTSRFAKIAKKFAKGVGSAFAGGGIAGVALGFIDKLLNPLQEVQAAIDKSLAQADDAASLAKQFGSTSGEYFRLQKLAQATGLDQGSFNILLEKFQTSIAEAAADPKKDTSVRKYANDTDIVASFYQFIQELQKMERNQQTLVQQEVFGERQILKMADFLGTDLPALNKRIGGPNAATLTNRLDKEGDLSDYADERRSAREINEQFRQAGIINKGMIDSDDFSKKQEAKKLEEQMRSYQNLQQIAQSAAELVGLAQKAALGAAGFVVQITDLANNVRKISESNAVKGIIKFMGGK